MPVSLFTGLPGSGKTAMLVKRIVDLQAKEPGRPIFAFGINGLKEGLAIPLTEEMLHKWWELPQGSIIAIDECQEDGSHPEQPVSLMPKDRGNPPPWVQRISKVRHYGMDFLLTTQAPANMSAYVRRLVDHHVHSIMRAKGVRQTYTWQRCIDDPDNRREKKAGEMSFSPLPKEVFDLYKSSSLHTMKVRTPRKFYFMVVLLVLAVFLAFYIPHRIKQATKPSTPVIADAAVAVKTLRATDYVAWEKPRVAGIPWTAPMFDKLEVKAQPRLYCIAVEDGRCSCVTEQGTAFKVEPKTCRSVAANGLYNPFIQPQEETSQSRKREQPADRRGAALPLVGRQAAAPVMLDAGGATGSISVRKGISDPYIPPTMAPWTADAFGGSK